MEGAADCRGAPRGVEVRGVARLMPLMPGVAEPPRPFAEALLELREAVSTGSVGAAAPL